MNGAMVKVPAEVHPESRLFYDKLLTYRPKAHRYYYGGEPIPSVTTIINLLSKHALIQWAADMAVDHVEACFKAEGHDFTLKPFDVICAEARKAHERIKTTAGDIGTRTHDYAAACLKANFLQPLPDDPEAMPAMKAFQDWFRDHSVQTIEAERMICSKQMHYAGRCDFYGRIDGVLGVMDIKTSKGVYHDHFLQLTGYQIALHEELKLEEETKRWILHLSKETGKFKMIERGMSAPSAHAFTTLVRLEKLLKAAKKADDIE